MPVKYLINFAKVPAVGTAIYHQQGFPVTLVSVEPHVRRDGTHGQILTWEAEDGTTYTSGIRSTSFSKPVPAGAA